MASTLPVTYFLFAIVICFRSATAAEDGVIHFSIPENSPKGAMVGNIASNMPSLENATTEIQDNAAFTFLSPNGVNNAYFDLDSTSGTLTASNVNIDRETVCPYKEDCFLEVQIAVKSIDGYFDVATVRIEVLDKNDNAPTFPTSLITLNISETVQGGAEYTVKPAVDPDMAGNNSVQSYELLQDYDIFDLIVTTDRVGGYSVKLVLNQALDREIMDFYTVKVVARDGGNPIKEGILKVDVNVIDANDNSPVFEKDIYNVTLEESIPPGTVILKLSAFDLDSGKNGELSYRFRERQSDIDIIRRLFRVNEITGELSVISDLHSEQSESFEFYVDAVDHGDQPNANQTLVLVQIDDTSNNAPVVTLHLVDSDKIGFVGLLENSKVGSFVAHINVEDTDKGQNGNVSCRSENKKFGLEKLPVRGYKVVTLELLDRETLPLHDVTVTCFDNGSPSLSSSVSFLVNLEDENDNPPQFDKAVYNAVISENNDLGDNITKVHATDIDAGINKMFEYALHQADNQSKFFSINSKTGTIYAIRSLDRETDPQLVFRVLAVDKGDEPQTGTATISLTVLDENDNIPHIIPARPKLEIIENLPVNTSLGFLNGTDDDIGVNGQLIYEIAPVSASFPFELTAKGEFKTKEVLNRELQNRYEIPVTVRDMGLKPLSNTQYVTITVKDENDNAPIVTFPNDVNDSVNFVYPVGDYNVVTSVAAYDVDEGENGTLTYSIIDGNDLGIFEIDSHFGEISVRNVADLDKDTQIILVIKVQDKGVIPQQTTASLTMNVIYGNATIAASTDSGSNKHIIISVVVVTVTILLAVAIVGIILFLRSMDRNKNSDSEDGSAGYADSGISSRSDSQGHPPETDNGTNDGKKKKEVSFALEFSLDGLDGGRNVESSTDSGIVENVSSAQFSSWWAIHLAIQVLRQSASSFIEIPLSLCI